MARLTNQNQAFLERLVINSVLKSITTKLFVWFKKVLCYKYFLHCSLMSFCLCRQRGTELMSARVQFKNCQHHGKYSVPVFKKIMQLVLNKNLHLHSSVAVNQRRERSEVLSVCWLSSGRWFAGADVLYYGLSDSTTQFFHEWESRHVWPRAAPVSGLISVCLYVCRREFVFSSRSRVSLFSMLKYFARISV